MRTVNTICDICGQKTVNFVIIDKKDVCIDCADLQDTGITKEQFAERTFIKKEENILERSKK